MAEKYVHVHVHHHEMDEDLDGFHFACLGDHIPTQIDVVRVQQAQGSTPICIAAQREYIADQDLVTVSTVNIYIRAIGCVFAKGTRKRSSRSQVSRRPPRGHAGNRATGEDLWLTLSRKEIQNVIYRRSVVAPLSLED